MEQPENNEKLSDLKNKVKFKVMSLKVKEGVDYVPELVCLVPSDIIFNFPRKRERERERERETEKRREERRVLYFPVILLANLSTQCYKKKV